MTDFHETMKDHPTLIEDIKRVLSEQPDPTLWMPFRCWVRLDGDGELLVDDAELKPEECW